MVEWDFGNIIFDQSAWALMRLASREIADSSGLIISFVETRWEDCKALFDGKNANVCG